MILARKVWCGARHHTSSYYITDYPVARVVSLARKSTGFKIPRSDHPPAPDTAAYPNQLRASCSVAIRLTCRTAPPLPRPVRFNPTRTLLSASSTV